MHDFSKNILHVQESYAKENMPRLMNYIYDLLCGYDCDLFDFAAKKARKQPKVGLSFFIFSFTGFAHGDFSLMTKKFKNILQTVPVASMLKLCTISIGHLIKKLKKER
jgi:amino acid transporter